MRARQHTATAERRNEVAKLVSEYFGAAFSVEIRGPFTIAQVEKKFIDHLPEWERTDLPDLPDGSGCYRWVKFKSKYQEGDELYHFISDEMSWGLLGGRAGHAIIRKDKLIAVTVYAMN